MTLLLLFAIVLAITISLPARYFGFYSAWLTMLATTVATLPAGSDHSSPFAGMSKPLYLLGIVVLAITVAVKGFIFERRSPPPNPDEPHPPVKPETMLWAVTGLLAGCCGIAALSLAISAARPAWIPHAVGPVVVIVALITLATSRHRAFAWAFAASSVAASAALMIGVWSSIETTTRAAETLAGDKPYCIQVVAIRPEFLPATQRIDLSPLTMRTRCNDGFCWQNHAILAIDEGDERRLMNWSHRRREFRDEVLNRRESPPTVRCQPRPHFARELPLL